MSDSGVIAEFLVNIGFKTDEAGQRRYQDSISGIAKGAAVLVTSLTGAAIAATAAVNKISTDLAGLFYSSQSLHATAAGITALDRAFEDLEGSMAGGAAAFQSFAERMRTNPLFKGLYEKETGKAFPEGNADQAVIDVVDVFQKRLAEATGKGDRQEVARINARFEDEFGVSSKYIDAAFARLKENFEKHLKEIDPGYEKNAEEAAKLRVAVNALGNAFQDLTIKVVAPLFAPLKTLFEWLAKWIDDNQEYLTGLLKQIWTEIGKAAHDLDVVFGPALRGAKILWDALTEAIKFVIGTDLTGLKGLHVVLAGILGLVTVAAMASLASMLTLGFAPFGVLAAVLIGILGTLTAINALFGGSAQVLR